MEERKREESHDLNNRHLATKHKHHTHLKKHTEGVPYIVSIEFLEALCAITALKKEGLPLSSLTQFLFQAPRLSGEHNRRVALEGVENRLQLLLIWVFRKLHRLLRRPAVQRPFGLWFEG